MHSTLCIDHSLSLLCVSENKQDNSFYLYIKKALWVFDATLNQTKSTMLLRLI